MSALLLNFRHVPEDEQIEVIAMLDEAGIEYYLTEPDMFGISAGGVWLKDKDDLDRAKALMEDYQKQRYQREHGEWEARQAQGKTPTFWHNVWLHPIRTLFVLAIIVGVLYISTVPFLLID